MSKTELRTSPHSSNPGAFVFEIWHEGEFIGQVTGGDGPGIRISSKHTIITYPVVHGLPNHVTIEIDSRPRLHFRLATPLPTIKTLKELGSGETLATLRVIIASGGVVSRSTMLSPWKCGASTLRERDVEALCDLGFLVSEFR
jgi:hypothetical protein